MYEVNLLNLVNNKTFKKWYYSSYLLEKFKNKCKYSKKNKILSILKY